MTAEPRTAGMDRVGTAYQMLVFVDSDACASDSSEMAALRMLHEQGLIRLVESGEHASSATTNGTDDYEVDASLYSFIYGLLHPEHDGGIVNVSCTSSAMRVAKAVRHGADIFVTNDSRVSHRDRPFERQTDMHLPFERQTDMHLLEPADALELVMQEILNAD